jgi:hypothetical protein
MKELRNECLMLEERHSTCCQKLIRSHVVDASLAGCSRGFPLRLGIRRGLLWPLRSIKRSQIFQRSLWVSPQTAIPRLWMTLGIQGSVKGLRGAKGAKRGAVRAVRLWRRANDGGKEASVG